MALSDRELVLRTGNLLRRAGKTLSVAESCTGGLLGGLLTSAAGASDWFAGGVIAYSNRLKVDLLNVPEAVIESTGAVSRRTAAAMAAGIMERAGTDLALAVTGIAGPGGGTPEKPVGTVCMALRGEDGCRTWEELFGGNREEVRTGASRFILRELHHYLREPEV
ncbi:MAG: CinA family protein [Candidatus Aegiribacteria sp.]